MTLLRALSIPFHFTSALLVVLLAMLLTAAISYDTSGFLWIAPAVVITSWLFKYAFAMLESIADGEIYAPVASIEMISPFEQRPLLLLLIVIGLAQLGWWASGIFAQVMVAMLFALVPAFVALLGATRRVTLALNPLAIFQTVRGMGAWYVVILISIALSVAVSIYVAHSGVWRIVWYFQISMSVLVVFSLIGGVMYERRFELGHEPRISPERDAVIDQRAHHAQLKRVLDQMYHAIRMGDLVRATHELEQWLTGVDDDYVATDCQYIHSTALTWSDAGMLTAATRVLAEHLVRTGHADMLAELMTATLPSQPAFSFKSESTLLPVVHSLGALGRQDLALQLVLNFVNSNPAQVSTGISALRQRLELGKF